MHRPIFNAEDAEDARRTQRNFLRASRAIRFPRPLRNLRVLCVKSAFVSLALVAGCSPDNTNQKTAAASNVTLTDAQKANVRIFTVAQSQFHEAVNTNGAVDFDNDQATGVMSPISGSVSRLLVSPGEHVNKGQALAPVDSPAYTPAT